MCLLHPLIAGWGDGQGLAAKLQRGISPRLSLVALLSDLTPVWKISVEYFPRLALFTLKSDLIRAAPDE